MLKYYGIENVYPIVKEWYDGYSFNGENVYCPWDVILFCENALTGGSPEPQNYWINTSGNDLVRELIETAKPVTKNVTEQRAEDSKHKSQQKIFGRIRNDRAVAHKGDDENYAFSCFIHADMVQRTLTIFIETE